MSGRDAAGGGLITWLTGSQQKNGPFCSCSEIGALAGHIQQKMVRIPGMADRIFPLNRRELIAGLGAAVLCPAMPPVVLAQGPRPSMMLRAKADVIALRPGG